MDFKKYLTKSNIFILVCSLIILGLFLFTIHNLIETYTNAPLNSDAKIAASSTCASLIVALISIISTVINTNLTKESIKQTNDNIEENRKHNLETINQTNELIKQNEENLFIQLRYADAHSAINDLIKYIESTFGIYEQLVNLEKSNIPEKKEYLSPRAFLVMQFINIISNYESLIKLPITLRIKIESGFIDFTGENFEILRDNSKFNKLLEEKGYINDYESSFKIIRFNKPSKSIQNNMAYNKFIDEFNSAEDIEMNESVFRYYYGFKNIKTEDFYNHFDNIHKELTTKSTAELILNDFLEE